MAMQKKVTWGLAYFVQFSCGRSVPTLDVQPGDQVLQRIPLFKTSLLRE